MKYCFLGLISIFLFNCKSTTTQEQLVNAQQKLKAAKLEIADLQAQLDNTGALVHIVLLPLQSNKDQSMVVSELKRLSVIEQVQDLEIGVFENLGDFRALSNYGVAMQINFNDSTAYRLYQNHPTHLAVKENLKVYLSAPPATYDFIQQQIK